MIAAWSEGFPFHLIPYTLNLKPYTLYLLLSMKNYYIILGLPKTAGKNRIKQAYREKAKAHHPDKCDSTENKKKFMEAKEAYDTLSDDAKRAEYDRKIKQKGAGRTIPVDTSRHFGCSGRKPGRSPLQDTTDSMYDWRRRAPKNLQERRLELILSPKEARAGGQFAIAVPIAFPCPYCGHGGLLAQLFCPACGGAGTVQFEHSFILEIPPDIKSGTTFRKLAHDDGHTQTYIHATVLVEDEF
ncbi:MAG TPA: DnaJ domain-containing protein [Desulfosalsimonadaceae bacterium]|nr:DnaJ domain-containing protein [Desulfosalsimonadaceae bacterium]